MKKRLVTAAFVLFAATATLWSDGGPVNLASIDTELRNTYAIGTFSEHYAAGIGGGVQLGFSLDFAGELGIITSLDYCCGLSKTVWVDSFQDLALTAGLSYTFIPEGPFSVEPEAAYGVCAHVVPGDADRDGVKTAAFYLDQMLSFSVKFAYSINPDFSIFFSPEMLLYLENGSPVPLAGYNLGGRFNL